jgi:PleD family two-component response regulator
MIPAFPCPLIPLGFARPGRCTDPLHGQPWVWAETRWSAMRVLIVDDEPDDRRALRVVLETMGHAVDEAASGPGAL